MLDPVSAAILAAGAVGAGAIASSGGGGSSGAVSTQTQQQRILLRDLIQKMLLPQIGEGLTPYQGQRVAPLGGLQQAGLGFFNQLTPSLGGTAGVLGQALNQYDPSQGQGFLNQAGPALSNVLADFDPASAQQYWQTAFRDPAMQTFREDIMPGIAERFAGQNAAQSGAFARTAAREGGRFATGLNAQLAQILFQAEQAQQGRQQTGINQAMQMAQAPAGLVGQAGAISSLGAQLAGTGMQAGGLQQSQQQQLLDAARQQYEEGQPYSNPYLTQFLPQALGGGQVAPYYQQPNTSLGQSLMQPVGAMLGSQGFWNALSPQQPTNFGLGQGEILWP